MSQNTFRTLVVDDEPQVTTLGQRALRRCGIDCDTASDGEQALQMHRSHPYDAVVTDLRMPRRHGHSLASELLGIQPAPHVFVVTALAEPRLVRDLLDRGVDDVLIKPVNFDVLAAKLQAAIQRSQGGVGTLGTAPPPSRIDDLVVVEQSLKELGSVFEDRLHPLFPNGDELSDPPPAVTGYIERLDIEEQAEIAEAKFANIRKHRRVTVSATAIAVPTDRRLNSAGDPFKLTIRDLSEGGIRMLHTRATTTDYLALSWRASTLPYTTLQVPVRVLRCKLLGRFYDIGGQFVLAD